MRPQLKIHSTANDVIVELYARQKGERYQELGSKTKQVVMTLESSVRICYGDNTY